MYLSTTPELSQLISSQSLEYSRNVEEIRFSQEKSLLPWQPFEVPDLISPFGRVKNVNYYV